MGAGLVSNWVGGRPMTPDRLDWIKSVLIGHGVSDVGAGQIIRSEPVASLSDRKKLLELLNMVVAEPPDRRRFRGKG